MKLNVAGACSKFQDFIVPSKLLSLVSQSPTIPQFLHCCMNFIIQAVDNMCEDVRDGHAAGCAHPNLLSHKFLHWHT